MALIIDQLTNYSFAGNSGLDYAIALGVFLIILVFFRFLKTSVFKSFGKLAKNSKTKLDDFVYSFIERIKWPFYVYISFYISSRLLSLPDIVDKFLFYFLVLLVGYYAIVAVNRMIDYIKDKEIEKRKKERKGNYSMINVLAIIAKLTIYVIVILMILSNLGVKITPLIASLGVGGVAVALALQTVLADLFSAFAIYFDKPFQEGDFIIVGDDMGVVKQIGIKTTRIATLQGQELIISNSQLTNSRINNYRKMKKRRVEFKFGVEYGTPVSKLKKINKIVKGIISKIKLAELDRVHFREFGSSALIYDVVYYIDSNDYGTYMDIQQEINFAIKEQFEKEKISMAFPSTTVYLRKD